MRLAKEKMKKDGSFCSFCSRMKRGKLYGVCRRENYNVLAMGQHCDDLCESKIFFQNIFSFLSWGVRSVCQLSGFFLKRFTVVFEKKNCFFSKIFFTNVFN